MISQQMSLFQEQESEGRPLYRGGFPCQPHSKAGKRRASSDERDLWPEMRRVICELRPRWVVAENVRGLLSSEDGRFFRGILRDFSDMGFDVGWCCVLAADFGGVHRRERMGIIAYARESRRMDCKPKVCGVEWAEQAQQDVASCFNYDGWGERCNAFKPKLLGGDDGIPNWVDRIECIGNAVAPPQFYPFFKAIADIEEETE